MEPDSIRHLKALPSISTKNKSLRNLFFVKGLLSGEALQTALRWFDSSDAVVCVEAPSLENVEAAAKIKHLSEYAPEHGDASPREAGREWVVQLSETVLKSTGKPVWQSFEYKGISAWWFLEIIFQEPAYLVARRKQAAEKAAHKLGAELSPDFAFEHNTGLPTVPLPQPEKKYKKLREWATAAKQLLRIRSRVKDKLRRLLQLRFLSSLKPIEILCLIESENLRRHINCRDRKVTAVLPYAEGVIEELQCHLGDQCLVLPRKALTFLMEGWEFLGPALPPLIYKPLQSEFDTALTEVAKLAQSMMRGYVTLRELREVLVMRLAEYDFYLELLAKVRPKVVFIYNWEGVFRPLTTAARTAGCRVVGVQQALGPYLHALNHHETGYFNTHNPQGFATPTKIALWGPLHQKEFLSYGYSPDIIEVTGYARLDKHYYVKNNKQQVRKLACARLKLDPKKRYLMFTGQSRILDTIILRSDHYVNTFKTLCRLAKIFDFQIIIKPWTSDDTSLVDQAAQAYPGLIFVAPQNVLVSNADLLSVSDWLVGSFSSIIGEAALAGNACVLLNYLESRYYFDLPHVEHYRSMIPFVDQVEDLEATLRPLIENENARAAAVTKAQDNMHDIFGPCNGQAAHNIVQLVLNEKASFHA